VKGCLRLQLGVSVPPTQRGHRIAVHARADKLWQRHVVGQQRGVLLASPPVFLPRVVRSSPPSASTNTGAIGARRCFSAPVVCSFPATATRVCSVVSVAF